MTDRIHTPMLKDKAALAESVIDRIHSQPERSELFAKDDAILVARQRCNPGVDGTSVTFAAHIAVNVNFVGRGHVRDKPAAHLAALPHSQCPVNRADGVVRMASG